MNERLRYGVEVLRACIARGPQAVYVAPGAPAPARVGGVIYIEPRAILFMTPAARVNDDGPASAALFLAPLRDESLVGIYDKRARVADINDDIQAALCECVVRRR